MRLYLCRFLPLGLVSFELHGLTLLRDLLALIRFLLRWTRLFLKKLLLVMIESHYSPLKICFFIVFIITRWIFWHCSLTLWCNIFLTFKIFWILSKMAGFSFRGATTIFWLGLLDFREVYIFYGPFLNNSRLVLSCCEQAIASWWWLKWILKSKGSFRLMLWI